MSVCICIYTYTQSHAPSISNTFTKTSKHYSHLAENVLLNKKPSHSCLCSEIIKETYISKEGPKSILLES